MPTSLNANVSKSRLPEPETVPEGFLFTDPGDKVWGPNLLTGCIMVLVMSCAFALALAFFIEEQSFFSIIALFFMSIGVIVFVIGLINWLILMIRLEPGKILLDTYPLRLGESSQVRYSRRLRRGTTSKNGTISGTWKCYEWVQYTRGTETQTLTEPLWTVNLPECSVESGTQLINYDTTILVDPQFPPSFEEKNNKVRWELEIKLEIPGFAKDTSTFLLNVTPEVVR